MVKEKNFALLWSLLSDAKRFTSYYLYRIPALTENPVLLMKLLAFVSWLLAGLFLYGILRKKLSLRINRAFFISAAFILTPTFLVRVEPSILQHSMNIMLFFLAAFIYFIAEKNRSRYLAAANYILSWILFFFSFHTYSLLVFYGGFLLLLFISYRQGNNEQPLLSLIWPWVKNNFFFIILPIIFWVLKLSIWQPEGDWAGYDDFIRLDTSPSFALLLFWETIIYGFFWSLVAPILILHRKIFALLFLVIALITYLTTKKILLSENGKDFHSKHYLASGGILFFLGFLPYFLTGKTPHILGNPFNMRVALLLPVGASLIVLGVLLIVIRKERLLIIQTIILSLFMTFTVYNYYGLDMDWYKQLAIMESLRNNQNENLKQASTLIFHDKISGLNWLGREIHGEEYIGYLQEIYKDRPKLAMAEGETFITDIKKIPLTMPYPENFNPQEKIVNINITTFRGPEILTVGNWLKIKRLEIFGSHQSFLNKINDIFRVKLEINETRLFNNENSAT